MTTAPRTGADADAYARSRVGTRMPDAGLCLQCTRQNYAIPSLYPSAIEAWENSPTQHPDTRPPAGAVVPVFFYSQSPYRHVATALADGSVVTTNADRIEHWSSIDAMVGAGFGGYMGYTDDLNDETVYTEGDDDMTPDQDAALAFLFNLFETGRGADSIDRTLGFLQQRYMDDANVPTDAAHGTPARALDTGDGGYLVAKIDALAAKVDELARKVG